MWQTRVDSARAPGQDPRGEHSYALSEADNRVCLKTKEKDHNYYFNEKKAGAGQPGKSVNFRLDNRPLVRSSDPQVNQQTDQTLRSRSDEHLFTSESFFPKDNLPQYRSKDSALDEPYFEDSCRKSLSLEKINATDRVLERRIIPGTSDPDISRMSLQTDYEMEPALSSVSLPNSPPFREGSKRFDHTYAKDEFAKMERDDMMYLKNSFYKSTFLDHSYGSFLTSVGIADAPSVGHTGIKRGRSDENITKLHNIQFPSTAFVKSPFLDHTYQSVENRVSGLRPGFIFKSGRAHSIEEMDDRSVDAGQSIRQPSFLDHSYDKLCDNNEDIWSRARKSFPRTRSLSFSSSLSPRPFGQQSRLDHSYFIPSADINMKSAASTSTSGLSDSGTESINEEDDEVVMSSFGKDHTYTTIDKV